MSSSSSFSSSSEEEEVENSDSEQQQQLAKDKSSPQTKPTSKSKPRLSISDKNEDKQDQHSKEEQDTDNDDKNDQNMTEIASLSKNSKRKLETIDVILNKYELGRAKKSKLWGDKDEIALLEGLLEFQSKYGKDGLIYRTEFFKFVVGSIKINVSRKQVGAKSSFLRENFHKNLLKATDDGKDREFSNPHQYRLFHLSKKIWGSQSNDRGVEVMVENEGDEDLGKVYPFVMDAFLSGPMSGIVSQFGVDFVESGLKLVGGVKLEELNREWKEVCGMEAELCLRKIALLRKQVRMVVDAIKSSSRRF